MHPIFLSLGPLKIYAYGVMVACGFLLGIAVSSREVERRGIDKERFLDLAFWIVLSAIAGARLFHVGVFWSAYAADPMEILRLWNGGLVFYGGVLAAIAVSVVYLKRYGIPFLPVADASALGIILGLVFGRIGCTLAGCCFGKPTTLPWGIVFTTPGSLAPLHVSLHPTQPAEALASLSIFLVLYFTRKRFTTAGVLFWTMLTSYGVARFLLEFLRDDPRGFVGAFSESQIVSIVLVGYSLVSIAWAKRRNSRQV